jgi:hypothetical protein
MKPFDKEKDLVEACKWITLAGYKDSQIGELALDTLHKQGITFSPEQIAAAKQRAEEFMNTNQFALPTTNEVNGL